MIHANKIISDPQVLSAIHKAFNTYKEWRQVVDAIMFYVFCEHKEYRDYCNSVITRTDVAKKIKKAYYEASLQKSTNINNVKIN